MLKTIRVARAESLSTEVDGSVLVVEVPRGIVMSDADAPQRHRSGLKESELLELVEALQDGSASVRRV